MWDGRAFTAGIRRRRAGRACAPAARLRLRPPPAFVCARRPPPSAPAAPPGNRAAANAGYPSSGCMAPSRLRSSPMSRLPTKKAITIHTAAFLPKSGTSRAIDERQMPLPAIVKAMA